VSKEPKGYILFHPNQNVPAGYQDSPRFDVFVREDLQDRYGDLKKRLYQLECPWAEKFKEQHPGYVHLGSEDLLHNFSINVEILKQIVKLSRDRFEIVSMEESG